MLPQADPGDDHEKEDVHEGPLGLDALEASDVLAGDEGLDDLLNGSLPNNGEIFDKFAPKFAGVEQPQVSNESGVGFVGHVENIRVV